MKERHNAILEYITTHGKTEVSILAEKLHTSEVTIRKDLDLLEEKGMLKRERGYAVPNDPGNIFYRMAFHPDLKQRIARTAADCVSDGETVMIETGSTCILFAEELARTRKNVTIVTNSVCLAEYVRKYTNVQLILLGGILADYVFEPFMQSGAPAAKWLEGLVGSGTGSGMAVMFLCTGMLGFLASVLTGRSRWVRGLEEVKKV